LKRFPKIMPRQKSRRSRVTIVEVARKAGVSLGTVSRVINAKQSVGVDLRDRVLDAARVLGYVPNPAAQSMRTQSTRAVGLMVSDVSNPLFAATVSATEEVLYRSGYNMILTNSRDRPDMEEEIITLFHRRRFDGMIITLSREDDPTILRLLEESSMPTVLLERESKLPIDSVATDHYSGAFQAVSYLLKLMHKRIGLVTVTQSALPGRQRGQGYAAAHKEAGVVVDPSLTSFDGFLPDAGYHAAYRMLVSPRPPTAIVAGANQMPGVLKAVRALKLSVPRRLSIVQIGDTDVANLHQPPLTAVRWELQKVGAAAAELLLARLSGAVQEKRPRRVVLPTELVLRQSCAAPYARR
jgi:LacI family transcriptional regulator